MYIMGMSIEHPQVLRAETEETDSYAELLHSVEINPENEKPRLNLSDYGAKQMESLDSAFGVRREETSKEPKVVAIVRCWNKNEKDIK